MKVKTIISICLMVLITLSGFSQTDSSGVYFTAKDFLAHKLSFSIYCKTQKHKIKSDMIFHPKKITIKHKDSTYTYPKDKIYAIKYCDGKIIRSYRGSKYPIMNPYEKILIYKVVSIASGKGNVAVTKFYFSKDAESRIEKLTIDNVKAAFFDNHKFHDLIDMEFHSDDELSSYDNFHKIMKINRVLLNSL